VYTAAGRRSCARTQHSTREFRICRPKYLLSHFLRSAPSCSARCHSPDITARRAAALAPPARVTGRGGRLKARRVENVLAAAAMGGKFPIFSRRRGWNRGDPAPAALSKNENRAASRRTASCTGGQRWPRGCGTRSPAGPCGKLERRRPTATTAVRAQCPGRPGLQCVPSLERGAATYTARTVSASRGISRGSASRGHSCGGAQPLLKEGKLRGGSEFGYCGTAATAVAGELAPNGLLPHANFRSLVTSYA
jgi:hypothetical protein